MASQTSERKNPLLPKDSDGKRLCEIFGHYLWKPITADLPDDSTKKPEWKTETRYPMRPRVLWNLWQDANTLVGVRFGHTTCYALIDIDAGSIYCSPEGVAKVRAALETIGITRTLLLRSSWSGGLHLYIPLPEAVGTFDLAVAIKECFKSQGIAISAGQVEVFPNVKAFGVSIFIEYNAHRLPLQPGSGSCFLDDGLAPIPGNLARFLWAFDRCAKQQDMGELVQAFKVGRDNHRKRPKRKATPVESWRTDLETEITEGWTDHGQTNRLLKSIACYGRVFERLEGEELVAFVKRIATGCPGFEQYCGHQADIDRRCLAWARAAEKYYWPLFSAPTRGVGNEVVEATASYNQQRADEARGRIEAAIASLGQLPATITARARAIAATARVSLQTLYKHLPLWHPGHLPPAGEQTVIPLESSDVGDRAVTFSPDERWLEPREDEELQTQEQDMKCGVPAGLEIGFGKSISSLNRGVWGDLTCFQQVSVDALSIPPDELFERIRTQVQRLGWGIGEVQQFIAEHFGGRRRAELLDEELPLLLYHLQVADLS